jgi:hypothetical protein
MYFKELRLERDKSMGKYTSDWPFRCTAHHVKELFNLLLPSKYVLDGSSVFQINYGIHSVEPRYSKWDYFGCSEYFIEDFDFTLYDISTPKEKEETILTSMQSVLISVAEENNNDSGVIREVCNKIREQQFYSKSKIQKLCRKHPNLRLRVNVLRILSQEHGETWMLEVYDGKLLIYETPMTKIPNCANLKTYFLKSEWRGDVYAIIDNTGHDSFLFDLSTL